MVSLAARNCKRKKLSRYIRDTRGSLTAIVGVSAVATMLAAGIAIDMVRINREQTAFTAAVDAAALAVAASPRSDLTGLSTAQKASRILELRDFARKYVVRDYTAQFKNDTEIALNLEIDSSKITLAANHDFPTTIMAVTGITELTLHAVSEVTMAKEVANPLEIALVMDTTGSMGSGGDYIGDARNAANTLLDTLYGGSSTGDNPNIKVALVPFAAAVRLDPSSIDMDMIDTSGNATVSRLNFSNASWHNYHAWNQLANVDWNGCVETRLGGLSIDDTPPTGGNTLFTPYFAPDEPSVSGWGYANEYIGNTGTPRETTSISTSTSYSNHPARQKNVNKYAGRAISVENMTGANSGPWRGCAKSPVIPLTTSRAAVQAGLDDMVAAGNTVVPEGLAWGWRVLSPAEPFTQGAPYDDPKWRKTIVLMTDGENDVSQGANTLNGTTYSSYGYVTATTGNRFGTTNPSLASGRLNAQLTQLCNNVKAASPDKPITIYTIAFRVTSSTIHNLLRNCASDPEKFMFAPDGQTLSDHFEQIAAEILKNSMYLSK